MIKTRIPIIDYIEQLDRELHIKGGKRPMYLALSKSAYRALKEERGIPDYENLPKYRGYFIYIIPIEEFIVEFK